MSVLTRELPVRAVAQRDRPALDLAAKAFLGSRLIVWVAAFVALAHFGENINAPSVLAPSALTAPFQSATYTESLFLLLTLVAVYAARSERWWLAGLAGGLAASSRSNGVLILIPLVLLYLYGPRAAAPTASGGLLRARYRLRRDAF